MSSRWIRRLILLAAVIAAVYVAGFGAYAFTAGASDYLSGETRDTDCRTPGSEFGWTYEAVNYDIADDTALLAANPNPRKCVSQGAVAGSEVVAPDGIHLAGWYIPGPGSATGQTVVIVHGGKSDKSGMLAYAPAFHGAYNVLIVDLRNSGRSGRADSTGGLHEQGDLRAMLDWLERAKGPSWIAVMGNSNGAAASLAEALGDQRVRALILDSMHATIEKQLGNVIVTEKHLPAWPAAWAVIAGISARVGTSIETVDPVRTLVRFTDRPVLLTHGLDDVVDRPSDSLDVNVAAARAARIDLEVHTCAGASHGRVVEVCATDWATWVQAFLAGHGGA
jgi:pimeloyl-ACP methyl ester carboxylesterase